MTTFEETGREWRLSLEAFVQRNGRPLAANTKRAYEQSLNRLIERIGAEPLPVSNRIVRDYIARARAEDYSPATVVTDLIVLKLVSESVTDNDGNPLYPMQLNRKFCSVPIVNPDEQEAPCATRKDIERALTPPGFVPGLVALLAGTGIRISEALALRVGPDDVNDCWSAEKREICIRRTLKTAAAKRMIPLHPDLNSFLVSWFKGYATDCGPGALVFNVSDSTVNRVLAHYGLPPCHAYRRFYATHCDEQFMNPQVLKQLMGHSKGKTRNVTARYIRTAHEFVRSEVQRVGLGFDLPSFATQERELQEVSA